MDDATNAEMQQWTGGAGALTEQEHRRPHRRRLADVEIRPAHRVYQHAASAIGPRPHALRAATFEIAQSPRLAIGAGSWQPGFMGTTGSGVVPSMSVRAPRRVA
jgi:hypothetical protein